MLSSGLVVERLREVSVPLELGRHPALLQAAGIGAGENVLRPEEEQLVAAPVEGRAWNQHRPAERPGAVVEIVVRRLALRRHALGALPAAAELVAVPGIVALVKAALPWKSFDPLRVTTVTVAPELRPYSAWKFEVWTRTSAMESSAGAA